MKVNVFHVEGALPYVLSAHETTTIHFWEKNNRFFVIGW